MKKFQIGCWLIILFLLFIFPAAGLIKNCFQDIKNNTPPPQFGWENVEEIPSAVETWINDRTPFKTKIVDLNNLLSFYAFNSSTSDKVIKGEDGWLFYAEELPDYKNTNLYTEDELKKCANMISDFNDYLESQNIKLVIYIAPNKASIYGDKMPSYYKKNGDISRTEQLVSYVQETTGIRIIYPKQELVELAQENDEEILYFKLDTHWNYLGGYYGAMILLEELGVEIPEIDYLAVEEYNSPVFSWNGYDMAKMLNMGSYLNEDSNYKISGYTYSSIQWDRNPAEDVEAFENTCRTVSDAKDSRKIFLARDSFASSMMPVIASQFCEVYSPHISYYCTHKEELEQEKPDVFILEFVERSNIGGFDLIP